MGATRSSLVRSFYVVHENAGCADLLAGSPLGLRVGVSITARYYDDVGVLSHRNMLWRKTEGSMDD